MHSSVYNPGIQQMLGSKNQVAGQSKFYGICGWPMEKSSDPGEDQGRKAAATEQQGGVWPHNSLEKSTLNGKPSHYSSFRSVD